MMGNQILTAYLSYCKLQKNLDSKTIKAYSIDINRNRSIIPRTAKEKSPGNGARKG